MVSAFPVLTLPFTKDGHDREGQQVYRCHGCQRRRTAHSTSAFAGYRFPPDVIALAVRWHVRPPASPTPT